MAKVGISTKRLQINKANMTIIIITSIATFITIFSLVASKSLLSQRAYQAKVISKKETAKKQLDENIKSASSLVASYTAFVSRPDNVLGGSPSGTGDRDGDNARIILDALPSKYDFPAVTTSLEKLVTERNLKIVSISGTDDEVTQAATDNQLSLKVIAMPFTIGVEGAYGSMQSLVDVLERSIRPFKVSTLTITGQNTSNITLKLEAETYYQPEKGLSIKEEVVK